MSVNSSVHQDNDEEESMAIKKEQSKVSSKFPSPNMDVFQSQTSFSRYQKETIATVYDNAETRNQFKSILRDSRDTNQLTKMNSSFLSNRDTF